MVFHVVFARLLLSHLADTVAALRAMRGEFDEARALLDRSRSILADLGRESRDAPPHE